MTILSDGALRYEVLTDWAKLPADMAFGDVAAIGVDRSDRVFVFTRGEHPMIVLDREGNFLRSWGHGMFHTAHGLHIGPDENLYCTDVGDHTLRKCTPEGKILLEIGVPGRPAEFMSGKPFNRCTHSALSPDGEIYVSDGYGNASVHLFSAHGRHLKSWGGSGCAPGEFNLPHNIVCDEAGWVYVADRENHRIQIFDGAGRYETQWNNLHRPCALCRSAEGLFFVGELGAFMSPMREYPNIRPRVTALDGSGKVIARLSAGPAGVAPGQFIAPHGIASDSAGDLYVGELSATAWKWVFPDTPRPERLPTLHKLRRL